MKDILEQLAEYAEYRVSEAKKVKPLETIREEACSMNRDTGFPFLEALKKDGLSLIAECKKASPSKGLILPDVPYEEKEEFDSMCAEHGIDLISMIAPTSEERIAMIAKEAKGFIYIVSSLGVTGVRSEITTDINALVSEIRKVTDIPCAVGFGISGPERAAEMAAVSDGAIVGSAIVRIIAAEGRESVREVSQFVRDMSRAVHSS